MPLQPGQTFGPYRIRKLIGQTKTAAVYQVKLPRGGFGALKVLFKDVSLDPDLRARFIQTARLAMSVRQPGLVPVLDAGELTGQLYLLMPFVHGEDLQKRLARRRKLSWHEALRIAREVARTLEYLHERNIVHGDVKPSNIMLVPGGRVLLMDMGIANVRGARFSTSSAFVIGSPAYMSPEQIQGLPVDGRSDQYALGIALYEMMAGYRPFAADEIAVVLHQQLHEPPRPLRARGIPPSLSDVVMRMLAKLPEARFPDMNSFVRASELAVGRRGPGIGSSMTAIVVGIAIAVLLLGLAVAGSMQGGLRLVP